MRSYKVQFGQSVFDVALVMYGSSEGAAWLVEDNELQGWNVEVDQDLIVRDAVIDQSIVDYYATKGIHPATDEPFYVGSDFNDDFNDDYL